jgi:hypothetical protein
MAVKLEKEGGLIDLAAIIKPANDLNLLLLGMEAGQSIVRIGEARGHCHKIST